MVRSKTKKAADAAKAAASASRKTEGRASPAAGVVHVTSSASTDDVPVGRQICLEDVHAAMRRASSEVDTGMWAQMLLENDYIKRLIIDAAELRLTTVGTSIPTSCVPMGMTVYGKVIHANGLEIRPSLANGKTPWVHIQWPKPN